MAYSHDDNGNLTNDGTQKYYYDCENRLTDVNTTANVSVARYEYDYLGRRVKKTVTGVTITKYAYDGSQIVAEYDGNDTLLRKFIYGAGIDEPICMIDVANGNAKYYYHFDGLGSVIAISDANGTIVERYSYDVFGTPTIRNSQGDIIQQSSIGNRFMFTGREYDAETGLYYYRARYYKPSIGRFLQPDPIWYINLYPYCRNNPVNRIDPLGLWGEDVHYNMTEQWAVEAGFDKSLAEMIATEDAATDSVLGGSGPWPCYIGDQSRHFDLSAGGDDSRLQYAAIEKDLAVDAWQKHEFVTALKHIGRGTHSLQDTPAHRDWDPTIKYAPDVYRHPKWYDNWNDPRNSEAALITAAATRVYLQDFLHKIGNHSEQKQCKK